MVALYKLNRVFAAIAVVGKLIKPLLFVGLLGSMANAQAFKFADTHPVNNTDSLERWLVLNPKPSPKRLRNLIILERTYTWNYAERFGKHLPEISRLARLTHNATADATYQYLRAFSDLIQNQPNQTTLNANRALNTFQRLGDQSGLIHAYVLLVFVNTNSVGDKIVSSTKLSQIYLGKIEQSLAKTRDAHDFLMTQLGYTRYQFGQAEYRGDRMKQPIDKAIDFIHQNPSCAYASFRFNRVKAISYGEKGQYMLAYNLNKWLLFHLKSDQIGEESSICHNMAEACRGLKRTEEGIALCQKSIILLSKAQSVHYEFMYNNYKLYRELLQQKGDYVGANQMADSVQRYSDLNFLSMNDKKTLELEAQYEDERKQQQIGYLQQEQQQTRLMLVVAAVSLAIVGFLSYRIYQTNRQLKTLNKARERFFGIIAHDLRRPMHAFQGMNELVSHYLKTHRYEAIAKLSQSIDEAGIQIQFMLDNLLRWALAQRQEIPYQPQLLLLRPKLEEVVNLFASLAYADPVVFQVNCPDNLQVYADPNAVELILRNLVSNALKAMDTQSGSGRLTLEAEAQEPAQIRILVADSGPGMSPGMLSSVRQVLRRPGDSQLDETNRGLGLILVSQFMHRNKGQVKVESSPEAGTTFTLSLPAKKPTSILVSSL